MLFNKTIVNLGKLNVIIMRVVNVRQNVSLIVSEERVNAKTKMRKDVESHVDKYNRLRVISSVERSLHTVVMF